jgi:hypothetical protein
MGELLALMPLIVWIESSNTKQQYSAGEGQGLTEFNR